MAKTKTDLLAEARKVVPEVQPEDVKSTLGGNGTRPYELIDVREKDEFGEGFVPGARHVPRGFLELRIEQQLPDRATPIVLYCASGLRSLLAATTLREMGYENVKSMAGGFTRWKDKGFPFDKPVTLTESQRARYSRHLLIPEVGEKGQLALLKSKMLLIGAGGLGSPAAFYLAAAGVGTIGLVDSDVVDESNLQRQILHTTDRVGVYKTESAKKTLLALNPGVIVNEHRIRLDPSNAMELFRQYDLIVDGSDNFATRYLVNDACVLLDKPNVHGSIFRFDGQATTFVPGKGPCYRCLFPEPPPAEFAPSCNDAGVLGVLPGVIGVIQAIEAVKLVIGAGQPLVGRLLIYDALQQSFREVKYRRDPECAVCGEKADFKELPDHYDDVTCAIRRPGAAQKPVAAEVVA